jgi:hypothetical protein
MKLLVLFLLSVLGFAQSEPFVKSTAYPATVLVYAQDDNGTMAMLCTGTSFEKLKEGYRFVTAAHCVAEDNIKDEKVEVDRKYFFVTLDEPNGPKQFLRAEVIYAGLQFKGDDFAVLEVKTDKVFPVVSLGEDPIEFGEPVLNVASPNGLGKQVFVGQVSNPKVDRPIEVKSISWTNAMFLQMFGVNGGSSGSAVICTKQLRVCGFIVGTIDHTNIVAIPVSRFKKFYEDSKAGKYKPFQKPIGK